ncbi:hypothetical protein ES708_07581 [subsurface metagenome]
MVVLILYEVFMRYVVHQSPMLADEFSAYMLVSISYLGAAYTFREKGHVRITALVSRLPTRLSNWLRVTTLIIGLVFSIVLTKSSYDLMAFSFKLRMASSTWLTFPLQVPQMTLAIGFTILSLLLIVEIAKAITNIRAGISIEEEAQ